MKWIHRLLNKAKRRPYEGYDEQCEQCLLCTSAKRKGACLRGAELEFNRCGVWK